MGYQLVDTIPKIILAQHEPQGLRVWAVTQTLACMY